jgi:hypothetical protein
MFCSTYAGRQSPFYDRPGNAENPHSRNHGAKGNYPDPEENGHTGFSERPEPTSQADVNRIRDNEAQAYSLPS